MRLEISNWILLCKNTKVCWITSFARILINCQLQNSPYASSDARIKNSTSTLEARLNQTNSSTNRSLKRDRNRAAPAGSPRQFGALPRRFAGELLNAARVARESSQRQVRIAPRVISFRAARAARNSRRAAANYCLSPGKSSRVKLAFGVAAKSRRVRARADAIREIAPAGEYRSRVYDCARCCAGWPFFRLPRAPPRPAPTSITRAGSRGDFRGAARTCPAAMSSAWVFGKGSPCFLGGEFASGV